MPALEPRVLEMKTLLRFFFFTMSVKKWFNKWNSTLLHKTEKLDDGYARLDLRLFTWETHRYHPVFGALPNLNGQETRGAEILPVSEIYDLCNPGYKIHITPGSDKDQNCGTVLLYIGRPDIGLENACRNRRNSEAQIYSSVKWAYLSFLRIKLKVMQRCRYNRGDK